MKSEDMRIKWQTFVDEYSEYFKSNKENWYDMFNEIKKYIDDNKCKPSCESIDEFVKSMSKWMTQQSENYKDKKNIMKLNDDIYNKWGAFVIEYHDYFKSNEEEWNDSLNAVKNYLNKYGYKPAEKTGTPENISLRLWLNVQYRNTTNVNNRLQIMKSNKIYAKWLAFVAEYKNILNKRVPRDVLKHMNAIDEKESNKIVDDVDVLYKNIPKSVSKKVLVKGKNPKKVIDEIIDDLSDEDENVTVKELTSNDTQKSVIDEIIDDSSNKKVPKKISKKVIVKGKQLKTNTNKNVIAKINNDL